MKTLPLTALAAVLALGACSKAPETTDNAAVNVADAVDLDNFAEDDTPLIENAEQASTTAVVVPAVPKPAAGVPAAEAAPLNDASEIESEIRTGRNIQRIRHGDGWAWMRDGGIIRTADRDGSNIAYFRRGADRPFLVQRGERAYAYQDNRPVREFDRDGRGRAPDADRTREATEAARDARDQRERADRARDRARASERTRGDRPGRDRPDATPSATPSPTPSASPTARGPGRDRERDGRPGVTRPSPTPEATDRPRRERDRERD